MRSGEFLETDHVYDNKGKNHQYWQEGYECYLLWGFEREHRQKRDNNIDAEQSLAPWEGEGVEGQPPLLAGREVFPRALLQGLHEALTPSSALPDERVDSRRSFLFRDIAIVIDHAYPLTRRR